jgi:hypothetical protein
VFFISFGRLPYSLTMFQRLNKKSFLVPFFLLVIWAVSIVIIRPFENFPINDDWSYSRNVYNLAVKGLFVVDPWPAMTLVSQTLWGTLFAKIFGFSFIILKCSVCLLMVISGFVLYHLLLKITESIAAAFLIACVFCFNPIVLSLSFTFMTDAFFLSFFLYSLHAMYKYVCDGEMRQYYCFILFCVIAVLDRQYGMVTPLVFIPALLFRKPLSAKNVLFALLPLLLCYEANAFYNKMLGWLNQSNYSISNLSKIGDYLAHFQFSVARSKFSDLLMVCGLLLLPLFLFSVLNIRKLKVSRSAGYVTALFFVSLLASNDWMRFPIGNMLSSSGLGPKVTRNSVLAESSKFALAPAAVHFFQILFCLSAAYGLTYAFFSLLKRPFADAATKWFYFGLGFYLILYFVFSSINDNYFDRYALPVFLVFLVLIARNFSFADKPGVALSFISFALILPISVFAVKDFFSWERARWDAIHFLEDRGFGPHQIDGGFEYNGWYKPGGFRDPMKEATSWWWVDKDDFIVTSSSIDGFKKIMPFTYQRSLPFTQDTLFILEKNTLLDSILLQQTKRGSQQ